MPASTLFNNLRDASGQNSFGLQFAVDGFQTELAAGTAQSFTVPSNYPKWAMIISIEPGAAVWVADNVVATVPGSNFSATTSELNPGTKVVYGGDVISLITSNTTAQIGILLYYLQNSTV